VVGESSTAIDQPPGNDVASVMTSPRGPGPVVGVMVAPKRVSTGGVAASS
jgi:hypothetical protein